MALSFLCKKSEELFDVVVFNSIKNVNKVHWDAIQSKKNIYLSYQYLLALETSLNDSIHFRYLLFYNQESQPVGIASVQILMFYDEEHHEEDQICRIRGAVKSKIISESGIMVMVCGSPFSCGENGFMFDQSISMDVAIMNVSTRLSELQKIERKHAKVQVVLFKEFWADTMHHTKLFNKQGYKEFMIDVNMVMKILPLWKNFDDYLFSLTTKFRTKAKSAFKKSERLQIVDFQTSDIQIFKTELEILYQSVLFKSPFKFGSLSGDAFLMLKEELKDQFIVSGYFLDKKIVGFSTAFICDKVMDANYVGIDYEYNTNYAIYQRMLYEYINLAIANGCEELRFGRTAEEIKSTVGAVPKNMILFMRHNNRIKNALLNPIIGSIAPRSFELRNPYKANI